MTQYLPPNLLALFAPRDPIKYLPPNAKLVIEKKTDGYVGVSDFLGHFEDPKDTPPATRGETKDERLERRRREKADAALLRIEARKEEWDPSANPALTTDAFKTLFVARINYDTSESKLRREFEYYGPIRMIHMVHCKKTGKPRGYAFIEYEHERDMHTAYKSADGKKIDSRRVLVDVERSRTVKGWFPRSLGGGLGGTRRGGPDQNTRHSGREDPSGAIGNRGEDDRGARDRGGRREDRRGGPRGRSRSKSRERRRERDRDRERDQERDRRRERERRDRDRDRDRDRRRRRDRRHDEDRKPTAGELAERDSEYKVKLEKHDDYPEVAVKEPPPEDQEEEAVKKDVAPPKEDVQPNGLPEGEKEKEKEKEKETTS